MALLEVKHLNKQFKVPQGLLYAVNDVSFTLDANSTLGIVGESGCGKSTLGRVIIHLLEKTSGEIWFDGEDVSDLKRDKLTELRRKMQMIFQDPYSSLNPKMSVADIIGEPLKIFFPKLTRTEYEKKVKTAMDTVGLEQRCKYSYPHELDGGRRQRIGIARALIMDPKFIVCDEPVSALDVSIQAQVLNLMQDLQKEHGFSYMFITHNLSVVKHISNDIAVMYLGRIVEKASSQELFRHRYHPYTKALISAIPIPKVDPGRRRVTIKGEIVSPVNIRPGCQFAARCPYAKERCFQESPKLEEVIPLHFVECHYTREIHQMSDTNNTSI